MSTHLKRYPTTYSSLTTSAKTLPSLSLSSLLKIRDFMLCRIVLTKCRVLIPFLDYCEYLETKVLACSYSFRTMALDRSWLGLLRKIVW